MSTAKSVVPNWTYLFFVPIALGIAYSFVIHAFPDWLVAVEAVFLLAFAGVSTYYYARAKQTKNIVALWLCIIVAIMTYIIGEGI